MMKPIWRKVIPLCSILVCLSVASCGDDGDETNTTHFLAEVTQVISPPSRNPGPGIFLPSSLADPTPGLITIVAPGQVTITKGQPQEFQVQVVNAAGANVRMLKALLAVEGAGGTIQLVFFNPTIGTVTIAVTVSTTAPASEFVLLIQGADETLNGDTINAGTPARIRVVAVD